MEGGRMRAFGRVVVGLAALLVLGLAVHGVKHEGGTGRAAAPTAPGPSSSAPKAAASASASGATSSGNYEPAHFAAQVRARAGQAGIDPQLLMAILYNESYKPHDPALERAWQALKPDSAFGIANMHRAAFDDTKTGRDFANRRWEELPDDPDLAIDAAAWFLHDLAAQLPAHPSGGLTRDDLLAVGYNAGAGNMLAIADGTAPGPAARSYLDQLHANWDKAARALAG
jgi:hypothetical protein